VASAQIKSAVILAGLGVDGPTTVVSPAPSRDHTERMLRHGGLDVVSTIAADGSENVTVHPGAIVLSEVSAARDPSAAAFWHVAGAFGTGRITTPGVCLNEGRTGALDVLRALGVDVLIEDSGESSGEPVGTVVVSSRRAADHPAMSQPVQVSGTLVVRSIDELPILALAGALSSCGLEVRDAGELRVKESDRIQAVAELFRALGMQLEERVDGFLIRGGQRPGGGSVHAGGDHRLAMTAAIAATLGTAPVDIAGFSSVATSYPAFLDDLTALGGRWEPLDD
jgi:3-phosphoshikimate 1-carboxyvinyltransferase